MKAEEKLVFLVLRAHSIIQNAYPNAPEGSIAGDWIRDSGVTTEGEPEASEPMAPPALTLAQQEARAEREVEVAALRKAVDLLCEAAAVRWEPHFAFICPPAFEAAVRAAARARALLEGK